MNLFQVAWDDYTENVSAADMTISLGCGYLLYSAAVLLRPKRILDLGSGFSSYVLRTYVEGCEDPIVIYSVDTKKRWLDKTAEFLENYGVNSDNMILWPDFKAGGLKNFDFVFHDLGNMRTRRDSLKVVEERCSLQSVIVLDDMHKARWREYAYEFLEGKGYSLRSLQWATVDDYSRFAEVAIREDSCRTTRTSLLLDVEAAGRNTHLSSSNVQD